MNEFDALETHATTGRPVAANPMSLEGRRIIVTGAGQGIGRAIAELAVDLGAFVMAVDTNEAALDAWVGDRDGPIMKLVGSVSDREFANSAVGACVQRFGGVDGLVNNAGIVRAAMIRKMTADEWSAVMDVNLSGSFYFLQAVGSHLIAKAEAGESSRGAIVNISSDAGRRGTVGQINYGVAKSGLLGLTMSAAREWARFGIRVNSVCFGIVETAMTEVVRGPKFRDNYLAQIPLGRWSTPDEVAPPVCFLLSDGASYITGQHLSANGGYHIGF